MKLLLLASLAWCALQQSLAGTEDLASAETNVLTQIPPATVEELDLNAYLGQWFQVYTSLLPQETFEKNGYCITAEYSPLPTDGDIISFKVVNTEK